MDLEVDLVDLEEVVLFELDDLLELDVLELFADVDFDADDVVVLEEVVALVVFAELLPEVFAKLSVSDTGARDTAATTRETIKKRLRNM